MNLKKSYKVIFEKGANLNSTGSLLSVFIVQKGKPIKCKMWMGWNILIVVQSSAPLYKICLEKLFISQWIFIRATHFKSNAFEEIKIK